MLDWLRYFPLAFGFLQNHKYLTPKGPYFSKLRPQRWQLGDSALAFKAPWANSVLGAQRYGWRSESRSPGSEDICSAYTLHSYSKDWMPLDRWQGAHFFARTWYFVGPWFSGMRSSLSMFASLLSQTTRDDFHNASFFHPRVFETVIADYLNSSYGLRKMGRKPRYRGPMNWRVLPISSSVQAVCFDIHKIEQSVENPDLTRVIMFPISHKQFVKIVFDYGGMQLIENSSDITPLLDLNEAIINSFRLEVGPTMQAQWDEVKAYCPDMSPTTEYAELKWPIKPEDVGKAQDPAPVPPKPELLIASTRIKRVE